MGSDNTTTQNSSGTGFQASMNMMPYTWAPEAKTAQTPTYTFMGKDINDKTAFDDYVNALYEPTKQNLTDTYFSDTGSAINKANSMGTLNSLGFQDYRTNQIDKNYANQLNNAYNSAQLSANEYLNNLKTQAFQNEYQNAAMLNDYISNSYNNYNNYNLNNSMGYNTSNSYGSTTSPRQKIFGMI